MPESSDVSHDPPLRFSAATTDHHPSVVGPYRILGVLGTGGMGTVYAAEQLHPRRTVALKGIRSEYASEDSIRRLARVSELDRHRGHESLGGPGRLDDPRNAADLRAQTIEGLKAFEFALRRQFGVAEPGVLLGRSSDVPAEYRKQVEEYYRSLGRGARAKP